MEKNIPKISHKEVIDLIIEKTGLKRSIVSLIISIFVFYIKRILIDYGEFRIYSLGLLETRIYKKRKYRLRKYTIYLNVSDDFKECIKGSRQPSSNMFVYKKMLKEFKPISKMLGITIEEVKYLYCSFWYYVIVNLLKYKQYQVPSLGTFEIVKSKRGRFSGISKRNVNINTESCIFKTVSGADLEINRRRKMFCLSIRLKRILYFAKVNTSIRAKPFWIIENDVPKATIKRKSKNDDLSKTPKQRPKFNAKRKWNFYYNVIKNRAKKN